MTARKTTKPAESTESAASAPAKPEVTTITFHGKKFTFPVDQGQWPTQAVQRFQRRQYTDAVAILLGPEQWDRLTEVAPLYGEFSKFLAIFTDTVRA